MLNSRVALLAALTAAVGLVGAMEAVSQEAPTAAGQPSGVLLTGTIRSTDGQVMEGVTVSAKRDGMTITTSVFTDDEGVYIFPPLTEGQYQVWAQAVGFETGRGQASLNGASPVHQNYALKTTNDPSRQLTGADWMASLPEDTPRDRRMKDVFRTNCTFCHIPGFVLQNRFDRAGWLTILDLMEHITVTGTYSGGPDRPPMPIIHHHKEELADYLTKVRGPDFSPMTLKALPRPTGDAARVVITEYDVGPADATGEYAAQSGSDWSEGVPSSFPWIGTHDVEIDVNGNIWVVATFNENRTYAKIDAETGKVTSFRVPDEGGRNRTSHGLRKDQHGIMWFNLSPGEEGGNSSLARLDPITGELDIYTPAKGMSGVGGTIEVDGKGKIWASTRSGAIRFDPDTGKFREFKSAGIGSTYGVAGDSEGNGYWAQMSTDTVGKSDIATGQSLTIRMPPWTEKMELVTDEERKLYALSGSTMNSAVPWAQGPARLAGDRTGDAVWVANFWGENLARIDIRTLKVTQYRRVPSEYSGPYSVVVDKNHVVWVNMFNNDSVGKFDPATEKWTEYMLPTHGAEVRHIALLDQQYPPVVVVAYWRSSKVARLQFRSTEDVQTLEKQLQTQRLRAPNRL